MLFGREGCAQENGHFDDGWQLSALSAGCLLFQSVAGQVSSGSRPPCGLVFAGFSENSGGWGTAVHSFSQQSGLQEAAVA
jgi:hypothetical protein